MAQAPQIILDVTSFGPINPANEGKRVSLPRKTSQLGAPQQSLLRSAVTGTSGKLIPNAEIIKKAFAFVDAKTADVTVKSGPGFPAAIYAHDVTVGIGVDAQLTTIVTFGAGGGLYFSSLPELGVYTSILPGTGFATNYGMFLGLAVTIVFGPPSTFSGDAIFVGADFSLPGPEMAGIGGGLLFSISPFQCIGFQIQGGFAPSVWPVDVTVQVSRTTTWAVAN